MKRRDFVKAAAWLPVAGSAFAQGGNWPLRPV